MTRLRARLSEVVPLWSAMNGDPEDDIARAITDLDRVAANLTDISMRILSDAIEAGSTERPAMDKRVTQARRAVEKAIRALENGSPDDS